MKLNKLCPFEDCKHYSIKTRYDRLCYYEPQCWRGYLRCVLEMCMGHFGKRAIPSEKQDQ